MISMIQLILALAAGSTLVFGTIVIWILMGYYSVRILRSFKGGILSQGWKYICLAVPFLIFGQLATSIGGSASINSGEEILRTVGASLSLLGGLLIVIGFRTEYRAWNPKQMKTAKVEKPISNQAKA